MSSFIANHSLLNPKFDGYKLATLDHDVVVSSHELSCKPSQVTASGRSPLSFKEVQSRIGHNHLTVNTDGRAVYIDGELKVVVVDLDFTTLQPTFRTVYELPKQVQSPLVQSYQREYASAAYLSGTTWFISDGYGTMYVFTIPVTGSAELLGLYELSARSDGSVQDITMPFRIHNAVQTSDDMAVVILSSKYTPESPPQPSSTQRKSVNILFDIWAMRFGLPIVENKDDIQTMSILWHRRGEDVPLWAAYDPLQRAFILIGCSEYQEIGAQTPSAYEPSPDEIAPIPRRGESLDGQKVEKERPPPYSWTQTSDSVTIAFPLPSTTATSDIKVLFSPQSLTLFVDGDGKSSPLPLPRYPANRLWDTISPSSSFWTWDREGEKSFGLLTLHLDKQREDTKWTHVFASAGTTTAADRRPEDMDVPETLDPSELYQIREALERYTSALREGQDTSGLGLGRGVPGLAEGEIDDEVDASIGREVCLTWVTMDGKTPAWALRNESPASLLSTPLPGVTPNDLSLVVKRGIDGLFFSLHPAPLASSTVWAHTSTYSALSFVLASKQDTRFTHHVSSDAVFAFESGARDGGGNVYIYRGSGPPNAGQNWAKQAVLKVGGGRAGTLLGVGGMRDPHTGRLVILCLCEGDLVILHDVL